MKRFCYLLLLLTLSSNVYSSHSDEIGFTIGVVPQFEQRKLFKIWQPIIVELERITGFTFHLVGSPKIPAFEKKLLSGEYDFAYMNPYHAIKANHAQGYIPLVRDGSRTLKGVLVVKKDSTIKSLTELDDKLLAFPSPNALGASLLMRAELGELYGISFFPRYVQTHSSVYLNVALGQMMAGGGVLSTFNAQPDNLKSKLKVIHETREMAPHPLAAHPRISKKDRDAVRKAFIELATTSKGQKLLAAIPMKSPVHAFFNDYEKMLNWGLEKYYVSD